MTCSAWVRRFAISALLPGGTLPIGSLGAVDGLQLRLLVIPGLTKDGKSS